MPRASKASRISAIALACTMMLAATKPSQAVNVSASGLGQLLLYPYYTVNGGQQTLITIVNTTDRAKAVRVHFREARNGKSTFWFNLYLGAHDEWTAAVFATDTSGAAQIISDDTSCTMPAIQRGVSTPFQNFAYTGVNNDNGGAGLERTRDGYIEVIDMGSLQAGSGGLQLAEEVTRDSNGRPAFCGAVIDALTPGAFAGNWADNPAQNIDLPSGGLSGDGQIVDVANGTMIGYRAQALDNFYTDAAAPGGLHGTVSSEHPDLRDANSGNSVATARVLHDDGTSVAEDFPLATADAVSLALLQSAVSNTYVIEHSLGAATEWVVTFPTKRFYVDVASNSQVRAPFTNAFRDDGRAAEVIALTFYGREQQTFQPFAYCAAYCDPPPPPSALEYAFGASANVLVIDQASANSATSLLRAPLGTTAINVTGRADEGFTRAGWLKLVFDNRRTVANDHVMVGPTTGTRYVGLPAIGFTASSYTNSNALPSILANFADAIDHTSTGPIETPQTQVQSD